MLLLRLLFDFGLLVLIWLVQLVIYPGFNFYTPANLQKWHKTYTSRITVIVLPLMLGQLFIAVWQLWTEINIYTAGSILLIITTWLLTFTVFVPLHNSIVNKPFDKEVLSALVRKNWFRTVIWTLLFLWSFLKIVKHKMEGPFFNIN